MARILIVEDESLIAMMLEEWVVELGHVAVGPASSVSQAMALLDDSGCDAAIIDYNLKGETADPISESLKARNVPFAFASGDHVMERDERFKAYPMLSKPYVFESLDGVLAQLLDGKARQFG
jgi:DNA-binding NtrC family response regulator